MQKRFDIGADRFHLLGLTLGLLALSASCSIAPNQSDWVKVKVSLPQPDSLSVPNPLTELLEPGRDNFTQPATVDAFDCYSVNIYGQGITGTSGQSTGCSYPGVTSTLATSNQTAVSLTVPSGTQRTIQMIGVATGGGCDTTQTLQGMMNNPKNMQGQNYSLSLLGSTTTDLFSSQTINIQNSYSPTAMNQSPFNCGSPPPVPLNPMPLPLVAGIWAGPSNTSAIPGTFASAANTVGGASQLTPTQISQIVSNTGTVGTALGSGYGRVDMYFSLDGIPYTKYNSIELITTSNRNISSGINIYISGPGSNLFIPSGFSSSSTSNVTFDATVMNGGVPLTPTQAAYSAATINGAYASGGPSPALTGNSYIVVVFQTAGTSGMFTFIGASVILKP
jgi:hypothetical protein